MPAWPDLVTNGKHLKLLQKNAARPEPRRLWRRFNGGQSEKPAPPPQLSIVYRLAPASSVVSLKYL